MILDTGKKTEELINIEEGLSLGYITIREMDFSRMKPEGGEEF